MGFEPTTFCMASRRSSQLSYSRRNWSSIAVVMGMPGQYVAYEMAKSPGYLEPGGVRFGSI
jgi:hypothetical protein